MILVDGRCWGLGARMVGRSYSFDRLTCDGHRGPIRRSEPPLIFDSVPERVLCLDCARARHSGCPCGFVAEGGVK